MLLYFLDSITNMLSTRVKTVHNFRLKHRLALILMCNLLGLTGCDRQQDIQFSGAAQGTTYTLKLAAVDSHFTKASLQAEVDKILADIDSKMSNYRDDSEISHINQQHTTEWITISPEITELLTISKTVFQKSKGCFDLTVKPIFDLWGFSKHENRVPTPDEIQATLKHVGMQALEIDAPNNKIRKRDPLLAIDLSAIAQGYSVQALAKYMEQQGINNYLIEIGGEMKAKGIKSNQQPWKVAIQKPIPNSSNIHRILEIKEQQGTAIMTAGTYRNFFEDHGQAYSHILDPRTGRPVTHQLLSVTVLHDDPTWADAWDTALLCMGETEAEQLAEAEQLKVLLIYQQDKELKEYVNTAFNQAAIPLTQE